MINLVMGWSKIREYDNICAIKIANLVEIRCLNVFTQKLEFHI